MHDSDKPGGGIGCGGKNHKMKILFITNHLNIGGITSYCLTLAAGLKRRGHGVYLASSGGELLSRFKKEGINYIPIPIKTKQELSPKILISMFKLSGVIKENHIDILHSQSRTTAVLACALQRTTAARHVSTCHGFFRPRILRRVFGCWGEKVIAISPEVKDHLIRDFAVQEKKIAVIYNGVDVEKFRMQSVESKPEAKKNIGLGPGPVIGIVARLSDVKGHLYLIQAMKEILVKIPQAQLLIVGEGKMKEGLVDLSKRLGIERNIFFVSSVKDTQAVLSIMDLFVMPSLQEGLGLGLMEAMAQGLAVVASDVGGIKSLVKDGDNGFLVRPKDSSGLAEKILDLLEDPQKRKLFGERAREFITRNFSREKTVLETERVYLECLNAQYQPL
jgi:glycosyltransferase involved in cell wall biosynthesis